jgi:hypothetical protein
MGKTAEVDEGWDPVFHFQLRLAQQGNVKAQYILGEMYEQGRGVDKNYDTAIMWYQKAEQNGHPKAAKRISQIKESRRQEALEKARAEAEQKRLAEEKARQLALQKKRAAEERRRKAAEARAEAEAEAVAEAEAKAKAKQIAQEDDNLTPEERAKKIKEAQERAQEIARRNAIVLQKRAEAQLQKYRASVEPGSQAQPAATTDTRYQDPFE